MWFRNNFRQGLKSFSPLFEILYFPVHGLEFLSSLLPTGKRLSTLKRYLFTEFWIGLLISFRLVSQLTVNKPLILPSI